MPRNRFIQDRIDDGSLVLYHDYRSGSLRDWSGNGNTGTVQGAPWWNGKGLEFTVNAGISCITVADAASLRLTAVTLVVYGKHHRYRSALGATNVMMSKYGGGATPANYILSQDIAGGNDRIGFYGGGWQYITYSISGSDLVAVNGSSNTIPELFVNGLSVGNFGGASGVFDTTAGQVVGIGSYSATPFPCAALPVKAALIFNRKLTATEHAQMYDALKRLD